ncbi:hypothetical protein TBLA_0F03850 [Henningerozyma blattae CBS 6284]|uniref:GTP:AMP phosphotransferase, mitochondrial n=1 Tax=Henningerozyma blattae (strain ATCC 34711 / CBS 6284 / DSM 70876 / NBRC 10599 / NRRL Y-10934 / UCD 77-7) TaxID=1071380 RepID=I2H6B7_HENB6|nr:hypothetical protein TBLA_0F03850 [Tetrapisispora blattae CBS 6284]CCH61919.1 hypothetical protein TBLA_0F03850 [Tetrapisispora blattae CBS 6284]
MNKLGIKPLRLLLLGAPGSGKGTQTSRLLKAFPTVSSISTGDVLRKQIKDGTPVGIKASKYMEQGQLLPDAIVSDLLISHLNNSKLLNNDSTWLLDGFPRTINQAKILDEQLNKNNTDVNLVVELDVPEDVILERIENRYIHLKSGRIYNLEYNPPKVPGKDDITGEPLAKRVDDTREVFQKRLENYNKTLLPLKKFYTEKGILRTISGETSDIISPKLIGLIEKEFGTS